MKKLIFTAIIFGLSLVSLSAQTEKKALETVESVDLKQYTGKWFEIARYENKFQKKCVGNTTATYTLKENDTIKVINECLKKDGKVNRAKGKARIADKSTNAKLEVRFAPSFLSFLSAVWGDYWIIDLGENYQYAMIGDPKREYFWILSREPEMSEALYQTLLRRAEDKGFDPAKVYKTPQDVEVLKGEVIQKPK